LTPADLGREDHPVTVETVKSKDGTRIACVRSGEGPPLVVVPGVTGDHTHFKFLAPLLEPDFSLWMVHRRGRGHSGDGAEYAIEREFEDLAAVVDSIGGAVDVFGHSFGADLVFGAMPLIPNLRRTVLYEPGVGVEPEIPGFVAELDDLLARGEREAMLLKFLSELVGLTPEQMEDYRASSDFTRDMALAHTVPREVRAEEEWRLDLDAYRAIDTPTLLLLGSESSATAHRATEVARAALPNSRVTILDGHGHVAMWTEPELVARLLVDFFLNEDPLDGRV
jgi:pimeloyl-ACP methyl ester carboxylesterase